MWKQYRKKQIAEMRRYIPGESMAEIAISDQDALAGCPKDGDFIARNPKNYKDQWLVSAKFVADNYEEIDG